MVGFWRAAGAGDERSVAAVSDSSYMLPFRGGDAAAQFSQARHDAKAILL